MGSPRGSRICTWSAIATGVKVEEMDDEFNIKFLRCLEKCNKSVRPCNCLLWNLECTGRKRWAAIDFFYLLIFSTEYPCPSRMFAFRTLLSWWWDSCLQWMIDAVPRPVNFQFQRGGEGGVSTYQDFSSLLVWVFLVRPLVPLPFQSSQQQVPTRKVFTFLFDLIPSQLSKSKVWMYDWRHLQLFFQPTLKFFSLLWLFHPRALAAWWNRTLCQLFTCPSKNEKLLSFVWCSKLSDKSVLSNIKMWTRFPFYSTESQEEWVQGFEKPLHPAQTTDNYWLILNWLSLKMLLLYFSPLSPFAYVNEIFVWMFLTAVSL